MVGETLVLSVQHSGTHFATELLSHLEYPPRFCHANGRDIQIAVDSVIQADKIIIPLRHPYRVATSLHRRKVAKGINEPYWIIQSMFEWYGILDYLTTLRPSYSFHFLKVDCNPVKGENIFELCKLLSFLNADSTPAANQFVADWALTGWVEDNGARLTEEDFKRLEHICVKYGYDPSIFNMGFITENRGKPKGDIDLLKLKSGAD